MFRIFYALSFCCGIIFFSCATIERPVTTPPVIAAEPEKFPQEEPAPRQEQAEKPPIPEKETERPFIINFAGDIMAHSVNFRMTDFSLIYADIEPILKQADISVVNFETPVTESRPYETYPRFNVKNAYAQAAIDAGFNVFALANNHTNDQGLVGVASTRDFFASKEGEGVYASGLRENAGTELSYAVIEKNGWKILFTAVTEFFNDGGQAIPYVNYVPVNETKRAQFTEQVKKLKESVAPDLTVLYVHVFEAEYALKVSEARKRFMRELALNAADIVCASHPHVTQEWEILTGGEENRDKLVMYSMGNLISGQRYRLNLNNPQDAYEYTGDTFLLQLSLTRGNGIRFELTSHLLTNYVDNEKNVLIRRFTPEFVESLPQPARDYYRKRYELMNQFKTSYYQEPVHEN